LLPEDQWAQVTVLMSGVYSTKGSSRSEKTANVYTVYERRLADKLDFYDWKVSFMAEEEDFKIVNDIKI